MAVPQTRRSQGTLPRRREQLPWLEPDFRLLSIDGGGIRGVLPVAVLAECERRFLRNGSAGAYFDLIAGTSTGGIVALGLAAGMRADEVLEIYMRDGQKIFPPPRTPEIIGVKELVGAGQFLRGLVLYRYDREPLERALRDRFGDRLYGTLERRLNVPTFDGYTEVNVLKTPHHPDFRRDWQEEIVTVALATSAAPTFFPTYRNGTRHFADGGVWANNPIMVGLVDALSCFDVDRHAVSILSLGCGDTDMRMTGGQMRWGGLLQWRNVIEAAMHLQSQNVLGQAGLLIGRDRLLRVNTAPSLESIALDDARRACTELPSQAKRLVEENAAHLEAFFDTPRGPVQFHHGPLAASK